ncbi:MarP family serine protease [Corynebacterium sp. TAE3-ERU12]|uniref:MarP family serine protease n=1 Tax=Corynebacterium sp. TAE3-ERU12 TaxID=2849491 RepID=UPI001C46FA22|nr:MarP family serine protease [Corynebacterium sp. TAE3-ERU12]MBV7294481.1 MarP family serine protease [Corynebacterium sp. TAE3-ERU12]
MSGSAIVDLVLVIIAFFSAINGWRQGLFSSVLGILGVVAGAIIGFNLAPSVMEFFDDQMIKLSVGLALIVVLVIVGNAVGSVAGQSLRNMLVSPLLVGADSGLGAVLQTITALVVSWIVAIPLATTIPGEFGTTIRGSKVLSTVDNLAPESLTDVPAQLVRQLDVDSMRAAVAPFHSGSRADPTPADPAVIDQAVVDRVRPSVVTVNGEARQCERLLQGTGFVAAPDLIVTNAHVVAGVNSVSIDSVSGRFDATVVYFDPEEDIAVLRSPNLPLPVMRWAEQPADIGSGAVVLGFPLAGPFTATPARIDDRLTIRGPNIYSAGRIEREAYVLRSDVRRGNSGGPLITPQGDVIGVVFGAGIDVENTGYALTSAEALRHLQFAESADTPVSTRECVEQ